jgi:hypothetical protein
VFAAGEPAQLGHVTVGADRQGRGHGGSSRYGCRRNRSAAPSIRHHFSRPVSLVNRRLAGGAITGGVSGGKPLCAST